MFRQGCSLSVLHGYCEKVYGGVRLAALGMPNILCMPFYFKPWGIKDSSYIWCELKLPIFLLRVGLLTLTVNPLTQPAYRPIPKDPTNKIKVKLFTILRKLKRKQG